MRRGVRLGCLIVGLVAGAASSAQAQSRSTFTVRDIRDAGEHLEITLDYNQQSNKSKVQFYAHHELPAHTTQAVQGGLPLGEAELDVGTGTHTLRISKRDVKEKLNLAVGQPLYVAGHWPEWSHNWGTANGGKWGENTNARIPDGSTQGSTPEEETESFEEGMPLRYERSLWKDAREATNGQPAQEGRAVDPLAGPADIASLPHAARNFAVAGSLLESEGKLGIRKKKQLRRAIALLKKLAKDPAAAEQVLGPGWSVSYTAAYSFADAYKDNPQLRLAQEEGGLRVREVKKSGQPAQLNYKDPGGVRAGPDDIVMSRTERFTTLGPNPNLPELVRSQSSVNPLRNVQSQGEDPAAYLQDAASVPDQRVRFQLLYKDPGSSGQPQAVAEISADHVHDFQPKVGSPQQSRATFFGLEVDIAHMPVDGSGAQVDYIPGVENWRPPHRSSDIAHLERDASIKRTYTAIGKLVDHMLNEGIEMRPTVPKYTEGMLRTRGIKPKAGSLQERVLRRDSESFLRPKNPHPRLTRPRPRAR